MKNFLLGMRSLAIGMAAMVYVAIVYVLVIRALLPDHATALQQINAGTMIYLSLVVALVSNAMLMAVLFLTTAFSDWRRRKNRD